MFPPPASTTLFHSLFCTNISHLSSYSNVLADALYHLLSTKRSTLDFSVIAEY